ncbi:hypothetical protein H6S82_03085 [Planktothrix sp. FACHB-1355]|uniref:Uncharacterized protein n=1 Tax=Aerosakkonema funiforme FACHB-1375 TaxID=2949571 RepID=A0A926VHQ9_9CYAN|nr:MULTISPECIES: hypothetical protein [Oscillatoriales]MBD2184105.1 hypothetical protein [Aerosakkonema funiforme FACHB-1375]MBD3557841.1 hypothetical protein [Planktothrix sp. FACHB-1355]
MVILENTKTQLKLRYRPYYLWLGTTGWILGTFSIVLLIYWQLSPFMNFLWMPFFIIFNLIASAFVLIWPGRVIIYHFDKDYNSLSIQRRGLLKTKVSWYFMADILDVQLQSNGWQHHDASDYEIAIFLASGESVTLNLGIKSIAQKLETINLIRKFLGMPLEKVSKVDEKSMNSRTSQSRTQ